MKAVAATTSIQGAVSDLVRAAVVEHVLPSVAVAVAQHGSILVEEVFGWADRENRIRATPHTMYSLASISKAFTGTGLMVLVERGLIDLDRPIDDYLGDAKLNPRAFDAAEATVRRVANHTAGLPLHVHFYYEDEPYCRPTMDETIRRYGNLVTAPGERYQYSNLGYGVLDYVITRVSGRSYTDFMREEVFLPLGMTRSSVDIAPGLESYTAARYGADNTRYPFYDFDHPGASAIYCSAHDLVRFGMFCLKQQLPDQRAILSHHAIDEMHTPTTQSQPGSGPGSGVGVGWGVMGDNMGYRTVSQNGGMGGVRTELMLVPAEGIAVALLINSSRPFPHPSQFGGSWGIVEDILAALLPPYREMLSVRRAQQDRSLDKERRPDAAFYPPPELLGQWQGAVHTYVRDLPLTLWFHDDGDVHVQLDDQLKTLVNSVCYEDRRLTGQMMGDVQTPDSSRRPHHLGLDLTLRDGVLNGAITAISTVPHEDGAPGRRAGNKLGHWTELRRVS